LEQRAAGRRIVDLQLGRAARSGGSATRARRTPTRVLHALIDDCLVCVWTRGARVIAGLRHAVDRKKWRRRLGHAKSGAAARARRGSNAGTHSR
jgi:hypothetical protein